MDENINPQPPIQEEKKVIDPLGKPELTQEELKKENKEKKKKLIFKILIGILVVILLSGIGVLLYNVFKKEELPPPPPKVIIPPERVVEEFYYWYLNYVGDPMQTKAYIHNTSLKQDLINKIEKDYDITQIDPIVCAKTKPESIEIEGTNTKEDKSEIIIKEEFKYIEKYKVVLSLENEEWKIEDIVCPKIDDIKLGIKESKIPIYVYFNNRSLDPVDSTECGLVHKTERIILRSEDPLVSALNLLFRGPTKEEKEKGYNSIFSEKTGDALKEVRIEDDVIYINLRDVRNVIPEVTEGCEGMNFTKQIEETIREYRNVKEIKYLINDNEDVFKSWMSK